MLMKIEIDIFGVDFAEEERQTRRLMEELEERLRQNVRDMEPEALMNKWLPLGMQGMENIQKAMWSSMMNAGKKPTD